MGQERKHGTHMVQDGEISSCYFPIHLRCATVADAVTNPQLEDALARALMRAFANALTVLPPETAVTLHQPHLTTQELAEDEATQLLTRISRAISAAARAQHLPLKALELSVRPAALPVQHPEELFDPERFNPLFSAYDLPSYTGGRQQVAVRSTNNPFARLLELLDRTWTTLNEFTKATRLLKNPDARRNILWSIGDAAAREFMLEIEGTRLLAKLYMGKIHATDIPQQQRPSVEKLIRIYEQKGQAFPAKTRIATREKLLEQYILLLPILRARITELDSRANAITASEQEILRQTFIDVSNFYFSLLLLSGKSGKDPFEELTQRLQLIFARLAFLDTFYEDPQRIVSYAVLRFARKQLSELWEKLQIISQHGGLFALGDISNTNPISGAILLPGEVEQRALAFVVNRALSIDEQLQTFGDLPASPEEAKGVPTAGTMAFLSASMIQLQVEVALVALWVPLAVLKKTIGGMTSGFFADDEDKKRWLQEIAELEKAYSDEI